MEKQVQKFFLGANSCNGFISHFEDSFKFDGYKAYLIKGGPGTGKSSLMKYLASKGADSGEEAILCPCSSDPYSLDGVIFPKIKAVVLDATAPHVVEPKLPGAKEQILNLGAFWDGDMLYKNREKIAEATARNSRFHKTAAGYLKGCGEILEGILSLSSGCTDAIKVSISAERIAKKHLKNKGRTGREEVRFLQGITPLGIVTYSDTIKNFYPDRIIISDPNGSVSSIFMAVIREYALSYGYDIITVKNTFLPKKLIDHILIPELSLAFVTENATFKLPTDERRIHARRFTDAAALHSVRQRLQFRKKLARELLSAACETLALAKASHDILEKYYIEAMDFEGVSLYAAALAEEIFG